MGARVNGRLVPLDTKLENGDTVEVLTSKSDNAGPSRDWLSFVKSPKARNKIRQWFSKERRTEAIEEGRDELTRAMRKRNLPIGTLLTTQALVGVADELNFPNPDAVFAAIGRSPRRTSSRIWSRTRAATRSMRRSSRRRCRCARSRTPRRRPAPSACPSRA